MSKGSGSSPQVRKELNITVLNKTHKTKEVKVIREISKNAEVSQMVKKQVIQESREVKLDIKIFYKKYLILLTAIFIAYGYRDGISSSARNHLFNLTLIALFSYYPISKERNCD